jgi:hypothetical protein
VIPLVDELPLQQVLEEREAFDFLDGVRGYVTKAYEFHGADDDDSEYCYLFWVNNEKDFVARVRSNIENLQGRDGWNFDLNWNGNGLVFMRAFL